MVETKTADRNDTRSEKVFNQAETTVSAMFDNSRKAFQAVFDYNRTNLNTSLQMARDIQDESLRFTDAWFDQVTKFQKNTLKSMQDYSHRFQDYTEKSVKENQVRFEESVDQTMDFVTPAGRGRR
ncbi:MAG: hypothetical protein K2X66_11715 [Cyanobacteria bacterium]|jgi:hypothetical protein|nr:hypothetical protein [Cyanobacteriota bacterium]